MGASRAPAHPCLSFPTCKVGEEQPYLSPVSCSDVLGQCKTQGPQPCCPARTPALQHSRSQFWNLQPGDKDKPQRSHSPGGAGEKERDDLGCSRITQLPATSLAPGASVSHLQHSLCLWLWDGGMHTLQQPCMHGWELLSGLEGDLFH